MAQKLDVTGHDSTNVHIDGENSTVFIGTNRKLLLSRYPRRRTGDGSDMAKLDPMAEAIELVGRDSDLETLEEWLGSPKLISIRVMTGQGGGRQDAACARWRATKKVGRYIASIRMGQAVTLAS